MFKNRTLLLIIGLIIILLIIMAIQFTTERKAPLPTLPPTPTPTSKPSGIDISNITFKVTSTNLTDQPINVANIISVTFSKPVDQKNLLYSINPEISLNITLDKSGSILLINPTQKLWGYNKTYQLVIKKETKSVDGATLKEDVIINFKTVKQSGI